MHYASITRKPTPLHWCFLFWNGFQQSCYFYLRVSSIKTQDLTLEKYWIKAVKLMCGPHMYLLSVFPSKQTNFLNPCLGLAGLWVTGSRVRQVQLYFFFLQPYYCMSLSLYLERPLPPIFSLVSLQEFFFFLRAFNLSFALSFCSRVELWPTQTASVCTENLALCRWCHRGSIASPPSQSPAWVTCPVVQMASSSLDVIIINTSNQMID